MKSRALLDGYVSANRRAWCRELKPAKYPASGDTQALNLTLDVMFNIEFRSGWVHVFGDVECEQHDRDWRYGSNRADHCPLRDLIEKIDGKTVVIYFIPDAVNMARVE